MRNERRFDRSAERADRTANWIPRTDLGRKVMNGEITSISDIFAKGLEIKESEIVDYLIPDLQEEVILLGGNPGKGGGASRTPVRITNVMHRSGRRRKLHVMMLVGNGNGLVGAGYARAKDSRAAMEKAARLARINIRPIRRGCGSWECGCNGYHSLPFKTSAKRGSVTVMLMPAPKGIGLCTADEIKKIMKLAGIEDVWMKSRGRTKTRFNFVEATLEALTDLSKVKVNPEVIKNTGLKEGIV